MIGAKHRCTNKNCAAWDRYGGKGIQFLFASVEEAGKWIVTNIGPKPTKKHTIDRIDDNGHYEPGNLRWATNTEQQRNKGEYNGWVYGNRMKRLCALRPDYTYEGLRKYVKLGLTDAQIIALKKPTTGRPRNA